MEKFNILMNSCSESKHVEKTKSSKLSINNHKTTFLFNMGEGWSIFKCMWQGEGGGARVKVLTSFIQQMHEIKPRNV